MLSSEDTTSPVKSVQTPENVQSTEAFERLPRTPDRRALLSERRQNILQQKYTDSLPQVAVDAKAAGRQIAQLREENKRLRLELEEKRSEIQQLLDKYNSMQAEFEREAHEEHQENIESYKNQLYESIEAYNKLREIHLQLEQRYQELSQSFHDATEEEARKMVADAARTVELSLTNTSDLLQDVVKTVEFQVRQEEDKHLVETLYLKREVQRMAEEIAQERQQIDEERRNLLIMQNTVREQALLRQKALQFRLRARWRLASAATTVCLMILLVALQFTFLYFSHIPTASTISLALLDPIVICIILTIILSGPLSMLKQLYMQVYVNAAHKKQGKKNT